ncbi:MAG: inorganic phosphate transporter [Bacteroidales bacterium]|nr:inorganic phosphate transporter [Bacteroidales bacterium]
MVAIVLITALIALIFSFTNGMNDAANCIASVVATKALSPKVAVAWAAIWIFSALFVFDMTVASTMGKGIVSENCIDVYVILSALLGSVFWIFTCTKLGLPISASHALIGGLIGPVWFVYGSQYLVTSGIFLIIAFIVISPLLGIILGFFLNCLFMAIFKKRNAKKVDKGFRTMQLVSSAAFSLGFGGNDGQKTMGIIAILFASAFASNPDNAVMQFLYGNGAVHAGAYLADGTAVEGAAFFVPTWLKLVCYGLISLGTVTGGWKVIRTLGDGLSKLYPVSGFCAETSGAITLILTAVVGIPVSTTHTITGSIIGTGLTRGFKSVKWMTAKNIVWAWVLTIPAVIVVSGLIYLAMVHWFGAPVKVLP